MLKTLSILGYVGMVGGLLGLIFTRNLFSLSPVVITLQAGAALLFLWARIVFGRRSYHVAANPTKGSLVTSGPYKWIRHPIYTAMCLFVTTGAVAHWSRTSGWCVALVLVSSAIRIYCEEFFLTARYPEYRQYAAKTWRMIPYVF